MKKQHEWEDKGCYSVCNICGKKTSNVECYSRVVGFFRPIKQWNNGKQEEFKDRKMYDIKKYGKKGVE